VFHLSILRTNSRYVTIVANILARTMTCKTYPEVATDRFPEIRGVGDSASRAKDCVDLELLGVFVSEPETTRIGVEASY